jgi:hypothetical protein
MIAGSQSILERAEANLRAARLCDQHGREHSIPSLNTLFILLDRHVYVRALQLLCVEFSVLLRYDANDGGACGLGLTKYSRGFVLRELANLLQLRHHVPFFILIIRE